MFTVELIENKSRSITKSMCERIYILLFQWAFRESFFFETVANWSQKVLIDNDFRKNCHLIEYDLFKIMQIVQTIFACTAKNMDTSLLGRYCLASAVKSNEKLSSSQSFDRIAVDEKSIKWRNGIAKRLSKG